MNICRRETLSLSATPTFTFIHQRRQMTKQPPPAPGLPAKTLKVTGNELPPAHTPHHDDWLLDEALVDTFSAIDPIAVAQNAPSNDEAV